MRLKTTMLMICTLIAAAHSGPLIWRSAKTISAGKLIACGSFCYNETNQSYNWANEEWASLDDAQRVMTVGAHFMLGYAPVRNLELLAHVPVMMKSRDTLSSFGLQDLWLKARYNFVGGKGKPYVTGVLAARLPTSSDDMDIALDDGTLDIGAGLIGMSPRLGAFTVHLRAAYWYNGERESGEVSTDIGDDIEVVLKLDYAVSGKLCAFLNTEFVESMKSADSDGVAIENTQKRRLTLTPGLTIALPHGVSLTPKVSVPIAAVSHGGSIFPWQIALDVSVTP